MTAAVRPSSRWIESLAAAAILVVVASGCGDDVPGEQSESGETGASDTTSGPVTTAADDQPDDGIDSDSGSDTSADSDSGSGGSETGSDTGEAGTPWDWNIPPQVPLPVVPEDNPMTVEKVELGRHLFYDTRLSYNETTSCATCHVQELGFADGKVTPTGAEGAVLVRNSPGLANVAYMNPLTWNNLLLTDLESQILVPVLGDSPIELGVGGHEEEVLQRFADDPVYQELFAAAFPNEDDPFTLALLVRAVASFCRSMTSFDSPYDRYTYYGETDAMSDAALRGSDLFFSEALECHHCHNGLNFTLATVHEQTAFPSNPYANTGLYNVDGAGGYPLGNQGLIELTFEDGDMGKFRTSPLRNIAVTAPYLHDGTAATLDDVIDIYAAGGRNIEMGPNAGDGTVNPHKSSFITGFDLTPAQRADLLAFLESLTDDTFLNDPQFSDPW